MSSRKALQKEVERLQKREAELVKTNELLAQGVLHFRDKCKTYHKALRREHKDKRRYEDMFDTGEHAVFQLFEDNERLKKQVAFHRAEYRRAWSTYISPQFSYGEEVGPTGTPPMRRKK